MKKLALITVLGMSAMLTGCGGDSVTDALGLGRNPPDEFAVVDRPPLALPPDFSLRPPKPGAPRPQEVNMSERASNVLYGADSKVPNTNLPGSKPLGDTGTVSDSERALLDSAGVTHADPNIRDVVDREAAQKVVTNRHFVDELLWWKDTSTPAATVDASQEAKRIQEAKASGTSLTKTATPVIEKQKTGWLGL
jgi:hypothetical protein